MKYEIWLFMLNITNGEKIKLLKKYKNEKNIYEEFERITKDDKKLNKKFKNFKKEELMKFSLEKVEWSKENNVEFISFNNADYPYILKNIKEPPYGLFLKGNRSLLRGRKVAIIGSRNCSNYASEVTKLLTKDLISYNITILSGGAKGVDSIAHKEAIDGKGKTVVVLGCGIDVVYPSQNYNLFKRVEKEGLIISEFLPGTRPMAYNFPRRNRIISGLSELVIVVEASKKSGSLITVDYALEQGKEVMAIPGSIFSEGNYGTNQLLRDGAHFFCGLEDLHTLLKLDERKKSNELSQVENNILSIISDMPIHIDSIMRKTNMSREVLFKILFKMQAINKIVSLPGNYYAKIN